MTVDSMQNVIGNLMIHINDENKNKKVGHGNIDSIDSNYKKKRNHYKSKCHGLETHILALEINKKKLVDSNKELKEENERFKDNLNVYNKYKNFICFLKNNNIKNMSELKNKINEDLFIENENLKKQIYENQNNINILSNFVQENDLSDKYNKYIKVVEEDIKNQKNIELRKKIKKKILQSKLKVILFELYKNKDMIKQNKDEKIKILENKIKLRIIKSKTINILKSINSDKLNLDKVINKIKNNKNNIKFDNKRINDSARNSNRSIMKFLSDLYEEKEINKNLSSKDFKIAVNEFHSDKNITRMTHLCKIMYELCNNNLIYNSNIIFKHIYSFQYIKEYQINILLSNIEEIIKTENC